MRKLLALFSLVMILNSCSEEFEPTPNSYSKLLTGENKKTWRLAAFQYRVDGRAVDSFVLPNDCAFDDLYIFYANPEKTFEINEGRTLCNVGDPQIYLLDSWSLINATATLEMVIPLLTTTKLPYILQELTEDEFSVEIYFNDDTESYRFIFDEVDTE